MTRDTAAECSKCGSPATDIFGSGYLCAACRPDGKGTTRDDEAPAAADELDPAFATPESGVWPAELLEREQWMGHVDKRPFVPWADRYRGLGRERLRRREPRRQRPPSDELANLNRHNQASDCFDISGDRRGLTLLGAYLLRYARHSQADHRASPLFMSIRVSQIHMLSAGVHNCHPE